jgi:predicted DNA binding CopG/RHH family protein
MIKCTRKVIEMPDSNNRKSERTRDKRIPVTVTEEERKQVKIAAAKAGIPMAEYIRRRVLPDARKAMAA